MYPCALRSACLRRSSPTFLPFRHHAAFRSPTGLAVQWCQRAGLPFSVDESQDCLDTARHLFALRPSFPLRSSPQTRNVRHGGKSRPSNSRRLFALRLVSFLLFFQMLLGYLGSRGIVAGRLALGASLAYVFLSFAVACFRRHRLTSSPAFVPEAALQKKKKAIPKVWLSALLSFLPLIPFYVRQPARKRNLPCRSRKSGSRHFLVF